MAEYNFPTETIDLPSGGKLYPEGHPLRSGKVDVKYMTAKEEDILTSTNLIVKGLVIDKLMESVIVTPGVKPDDFFVGDLNAVTVAARILAYGKEYPIQLTCNACKVQFEHVVDLSSLKTVESEIEPQSDGEYPLILSNGHTITFRLLTRLNEKEITAEIKSLQKINADIEPDSTTRLKYIVTSVNGNRDNKVVRNYVENMLIRDVRALREVYKKVSPDVSFDLEVSCGNCGHTNETRMPFGANFLWPNTTV